MHLLLKRVISVEETFEILVIGVKYLQFQIKYRLSMVCQQKSPVFTCSAATMHISHQTALHSSAKTCGFLEEAIVLVIQMSLELKQTDSRRSTNFMTDFCIWDNGTFAAKVF